MTPESAVRLASVARYVTDCATRPVFLYAGNPKKCTLANSEDPDETQHNVPFHMGLHCLLRLKQPSVNKIVSYLLYEHVHGKIHQNTKG